MTTKVGIAHSNKTNSSDAAIEAAQEALKSAGTLKADFALVFCSGKHDPYQFLKGVNSVLGNIPVAGGSCVGVITNNFIEYEGFEVAITVFSSDNIQFETFVEKNLNVDEQICGELLGKQILASRTEHDKALLIFYDSSKSTSPPRLNFATWLFEGIKKYIPDGLCCAGAGLLSDMQLNDTYQFYNDRVVTQSVVAVKIKGSCNMRTTIMHGCKPGSAYHTITKADGPVISEIDNKPALEVIDELLGKDHGIKWKDFSLFITLGVNRGQKFGPFIETDYANRLVLTIDENSKSLIMFEPDLKVGDQIQLMRRSVNLNYLRTGIEKILFEINDTSPIFSFYINCVGRAKTYSGSEIEDAEVIQKLLDPLPLMGIYTGVEIAEIKGELQPLDWTGVLCIISE